MIQKHIQRLEDLVKQSSDSFSDSYMKNVLVDSVQYSKAASKFEIFINWASCTEDVTYLRLKKKLVNMVVDQEDRKRRRSQLSNLSANYSAFNTGPKDLTNLTQINHSRRL
jgi:hypothetical protein